jgi:glutaminase
MELNALPEGSRPARRYSLSPGDSDAPFSIQSVSKVFTLTLALGKAHFLTGDPTITIGNAFAASEQRTGFRNRALANYMRTFGILENPVDYTLGVYFHHCAIAMSATPNPPALSVRLKTCGFIGIICVSKEVV